MLTNYLPCSFYNAFSKLQSPIAGASQNHLYMLPCAQPRQCFVTAGRSVAANGPIVAPRQQCGLFHAAALSFCTSFLVWNRAFNLVVAFPTLSFWSANRALATVLCTFCQQLCQSELRTRGNRDPTWATQDPQYPKNTGFRARVNYHASELTVTLPSYTWWWVHWVIGMMMQLTWWPGWHDGVNTFNTNHDHRP
jgi:hypothetical protein